MKTSFFSPTQDLTGRLLVASAVLAGTEFAQTVIYLCAHSPETGALGLVLNRKLAHPDMEELLKQLDVTPNPPKRAIRLGTGGPMEPGRGFVLHSPGWQPDEKAEENPEENAEGQAGQKTTGAAQGGVQESGPKTAQETGAQKGVQPKKARPKEVAHTEPSALPETEGNVADISANLEILRALAAGEGPENAVMFLGHAAWAPGQLEEEIVHGNAWFIAPATEALVFGSDTARKWENALTSIGLTPAALTQGVGEA